MKDAEDEAFDDLAKRQGMWGGGFQAKRRMVADKLQETVSFPCCGYTEAIKWNQFNGVVQCHICGQVYTASPATQPAQEPVSEREALKLALEALENAIAVRHGKDGTKFVNPLEPNAIAAIKAALVQPAQEQWKCIGPPCKCNASNAKLCVYAVFTPPPQREWVGLTETEVDECYESVMFNPDIEPTRVLIGQAIEAKLREKNT